jgi:ethanolamine ammonia-lyase small subunit
MLEFQLAHARARDAVYERFEPERIAADLVNLGNLGDLETYIVSSCAADRLTYLQRPDLGRRLIDDDAQRLHRGEYDVAFVVADGLSSPAVHAHAVPTLRATLHKLTDWRVAPIVIANHARVALGDEIGERIGADLVAVMIGERPGLSAPDSLGIYLTWQPRVGRQDSDRNCISNIHPPTGLSYEHAAERLSWLMNAARSLQLTGVRLKDESTMELLGSA